MLDKKKHRSFRKKKKKRKKLINSTNSLFFVFGGIRNSIDNLFLFKILFLLMRNRRSKKKLSFSCKKNHSISLKSETEQNRKKEYGT